MQVFELLDEKLEVCMRLTIQNLVDEGCDRFDIGLQDYLFDVG